MVDCTAFEKVPNERKGREHKNGNINRFSVKGSQAFSIYVIRFNSVECKRTACNCALCSDCFMPARAFIFTINLCALGLSFTFRPTSCPVTQTQSIHSWPRGWIFLALMKRQFRYAQCALHIESDSFTLVRIFCVSIVRIDVVVRYRCRCCNTCACECIIFQLYLKMDSAVAVLTT